MREAPFQRIFESAPEPSLVLAPGPPFTILAVSEAYLRIAQLRRAELVGRGLFEVVSNSAADPTGTSNLRSSLEHVIARREPSAMPVRKQILRLSDGSFEERFWSPLNVPVFDEEQALVCILHRLEEVTKAQRLETSGDAESVKPQVTGVLENITDAFFATDAAWRFTYVNGRAEETLGRSHDELLGKVMWEVFPDSWNTSFGRAYRAAMEDQQKRVIEAYSVVLKRWIEAHIYPSKATLSVYFHDVTQRKQAEAALQEGERRRRSILESSMDAVLLTTSDGHIVMANSASTKLFGHSEEELCRLELQSIIADSEPQLAPLIAELQRSGRFRGELTMKRKAGERFSGELSSSIFHDERGVAWTSLFIRDISERKARELERERLVAELDAKQRWLQAIIENVPLGVILIEPDGRVYVNHWTERLFGMQLSPSEGSVQYANRILYPDGSPVPRDELVSARVLRTGEAIVGAEFLVELPDGTRFPILGSAVPMRSSDGRVTGALGVFQDLSERMKSEATTRANERLLSGLFEILPVGLFIADHKGNIIRTNSASERIWGGIRHVGLLELGVYQGLFPDGRLIAPEEWALARAVNKGEASIGEIIRIRGFDGSEKTILNSALPLYDDHGNFTGAVVVQEDITKLKDAEEQLLRAIKLRDEVIGIVAHDLRNPLNAILLMTKLLMRRVVEEKQRESVQAIISSAHQMNGLIRDLLDVARLEGGGLSLARSAIDVAPFIEQALDTQRHLIEEAGLKLRVRVAEGQPRIFADADRLLQVLSNLLGNATKFTQPEGSITVSAEPHGTAVCFSVEDTGLGIPKEQIDHVFDRFWQANRGDKRGAGLGLAICRGLVEAHGGRIWVESEPGHGCTFRFTIPIVSS